MSEDVLRIEKLENGYEVEVKDPTIDAANKKPKNMNYESPWKAYAFSTAAEVVTFVQKHLDSLPKSDQEEFDDAASEAFKS